MFPAEETLTGCVLSRRIGDIRQRWDPSADTHWTTWAYKNAGRMDQVTLYSEIETYFRKTSPANFSGELLQPAYAKCFLDRSEPGNGRIIQTLRLENCYIRNDLINVIYRHLSFTFASR